MLEDLEQALPRPFQPPFKDSFESQADFKRRVIALKKRHDEDAEHQMSGKSLPMFRLIVKDSIARYDPEKRELNTGYFISAHRSRRDGDQVKLPTATVPHGATSKTPYKLGVKIEQSTHIGFAISTKLKNPLLKGGEVSIKIPPERARLIIDNVALALIGVSKPPWQYRTYSGWDDLGGRSINRLHTYYAAVNIICAVLIDKRNMEVIHEFK